MSVNGEVGRLEGLMIGLQQQFTFQREDIKTVQEGVDEIKEGLATETRKRIAADRAIESKISKSSTVDTKVEVNTAWRNRVIGGSIALAALSGWALVIWKAVQ